MAAVSFLTVLGRARPPDQRTLAWFPLVGAGLGAVLAVVWWSAQQVWTPGVAASIVVAADLALTGLLHIDGLADSADGMLAPMSRHRRLEVMRRPDVGAFGVAVVALAILSRWTALAAGPVEPVALVALWCVSRTLVAVVPALVPYAREEGLAALFLVGARRWYAVWLIPAAALLTVWRGPLGVVAVVVAIATAAGIVTLARHRLGGFTGDVLGATIVASETTALLTLAVQP
jgi:adenosylcobinamide-GDP ribazoletransferase